MTLYSTKASGGRCWRSQKRITPQPPGTPSRTWIPALDYPLKHPKNQKGFTPHCATSPDAIHPGSPKRFGVLLLHPHAPDRGVRYPGGVSSSSAHSSPLVGVATRFPIFPDFDYTPFPHPPPDCDYNLNSVIGFRVNIIPLVAISVWILPIRFRLNVTPRFFIL